ncbi:MAG TPA: TROVE domain-containing protein, partial [Enhygromyxa sp.]|nr:TROVE domain-containing protein [Enhygromyxa sp.]
PNNAGGYSFVLDDRARLERFLILGSEGGTYYVSERALTIDNAHCVERCLEADGLGTVEAIAALSEAGRAPKNSPAIFALAIAAGHRDAATRQAALAAMPRVCRTGTHLFEFVAAVEQFRGWGRALRRSVARWYVDKDPRALAYQVVKYRQRNGWSHRDVLRKAGGAIGPHSIEHEAVLRWVVDGIDGFARERTVTRKAGAVSYGTLGREQLPSLIETVEQLNACSDAKLAAKLIDQHRLTHEMVPGALKQHAVVWEALLPHMPVGALLRSLGKLTAVGVIAPHNPGTRNAVELFRDSARLRKARLHPLAVLTALRIYARGRGHKGKLSWTPVTKLVDALDHAFYECFANVVPSHKRVVLGLDVSGSMGWGEIAGLPGVTPAVGSAAMAMVTLRSEPEVQTMAFSNQLVRVDLSGRERLDDVVSKLGQIPMGGTDCSLPMRWALDNRVQTDAFVVYTDNETWFGQVHPHQALRAYRERMGIPAKLIVVGMTATQFSIADPDDAGMLDVVGFDSAAPAVMADFIR